MEVEDCRELRKGDISQIPTRVFFSAAKQVNEEFGRQSTRIECESGERTHPPGDEKRGQSVILVLLGSTGDWAKSRSEVYRGE